MSVEQIKIPDIGSDSAEVTEVLVSVGDLVEVDQSLAVLESDKASVEVPCPKAGKIVSISFAVGDQVSEGSAAVELEIAGESAGEAAPSEPTSETLSQEAPAESDSDVDAPAELVAVESNESVVCLVPDIGADEAEIIEVAVAVGDQLQEGDSIVVAESDKASLEVPAEFDGTVESLHVAQGDKVSEGTRLVTLIRTVSTTAATPASTEDASADQLSDTVETDVEPPLLQDVALPAGSAEPLTYQVPDVGSDSAEVIEVVVAVGDSIEEGDSVCVVETDKASVEVPSPASGTIEELFVSAGTQISQGQDFIRILGEVEQGSAQAPATPSTETKQSTPESPAPSVSKAPAVSKTPAVAKAGSSSSDVYAGPATRKHARELGVELSQIKGTGSRGRILVEDINQFVKQRMQSGGASLEAGGGRTLPEVPALDWSKFGDIEIQSMSRIHKATAANMVRNWLNVPHVTQFDDADVTELEKYRAYLKSEASSRGIKMTPLAFLLKACAVALTENPKMNSSLHHNGEDLVFRKFVHISIAVDTPAGLMVPVIRDVDQKNIWELAADVSAVATKAKEGKLGAKEMQGASFTISSLGAIGGTGFTPIVSAPQVGILGVSKTSMQPVWDGKTFIPRKMMPLSLSYDHRAVNGADAGKFMTSLVEVLEDLDRIWNG